MKVKVSYSEIWRISFPIMLSSLASTIINFTDVAFVSRIGEKELAASAIGGVFYFLLLMLGTAIGIGSQIMMARKAGEEQYLHIGKIFDHSLVLLFAFSVLMLLLLYLPLNGLMPSIIIDTKVAQAAVDYLLARSWSLPLMMLLISLRSFYTAITLTRIITYTTVLMLVLNVILNYGFVMGGFGLPKLGIAGSGMASAISETIAVIYALVYTRFHSKVKPFHLFRFKDMSLSYGWQILSLSIPVMLQHLFSMGAWFLFFVLIEKLGARELAVSNVLRSIYMVLMTPVWGFSQAANSMVSNLLGQQKEDAVLLLVRKIAILSLIMCTLGIVLTFFCREALFKIVSSDEILMLDAMHVFYVVCLATLVFSVSMVLLSAVSGTGNTKAAMGIEIISLFVYTIYIIAFTIIIPQSLEVVWLAELIYWLLMGAISYFYMISLKWIKYPLKSENL